MSNYEITVFNASGDQLFVNGPDTDAVQWATVTDSLAVDEFIRRLRATYSRWDDDNMRFRRNKVRKVEVRGDGGREEWTRRADGSFIQTGWFQGDGTRLGFTPRVIRG